MENPDEGVGLSRGIADRRRELGLSHGQVARRAGLAEQLVRDVEKLPVEISAAALWRLAAALETTPRRLLGPGPSALASKPKNDHAS